jgi:hypothetical protein
MMASFFCEQISLIIFQEMSFSKMIKLMRKNRKSNHTKNVMWSHSALIDDSERVGKEEGTLKN